MIIAIKAELIYKVVIGCLKMSTVCLDRLQIIGQLNSKIPVPVLLDCAKAHLLDISPEFDPDNEHHRLHLINTLNNKECPEVSEPYTSQDLRYISAFVNPNVIWKRDSLITAFRFLTSFTDPNNFNQLNHNFESGNQTPDNILSCNPCVIYAACIHFGLVINAGHTVDDMTTMLRLYLNPIPTSQLQTQLVSSIVNNTELQRWQLLAIADITNFTLDMTNKTSRIISPRIITNNDITDTNSDKTETNKLTPAGPSTRSSTNNIEGVTVAMPSSGSKSLSLVPNEVQPEQPQKAFVSLLSSEQQQQLLLLAIDEVPSEMTLSMNDKSQYRPANNYEAIVAAAIHYMIDISFVSYPIDEYLALTKSPYVPHNPEMIRRYSSPVATDSPWLYEVFNPELPINLYNIDILNQLLMNEGWFVTAASRSLLYDNPQLIYEQLQIIYISENFFHGRQRLITNSHTTVTTDAIIDLHDYEIVTFGVIRQEMHAYTYNELLMFFAYHRVFMNPATEQPSLFSQDVIKKLYKLTQAVQHNEEPEDHVRIRHDLGQLICQLKDELTNQPEEMIRLRDRYVTGDNKLKQQIDNCFSKFVELTMYMRAWPGSGEYPIKSTPDVNQDEVDVRVGIASTKFGDALNMLPRDVKSLFLDLPVYKYRNGIYCPSTTEGEKTICDRLDIMLRGSNGSVSSCIRLTSNWFGASAYRYMTFLGLDPGFDVSELRLIG